MPKTGTNQNYFLFCEKETGWKLQRRITGYLPWIYKMPYLACLIIHYGIALYLLFLLVNFNSLCSKNLFKSRISLEFIRQCFPTQQFWVAFPLSLQNITQNLGVDRWRILIRFASLTNQDSFFADWQIVTCPWLKCWVKCLPLYCPKCSQLPKHRYIFSLYSF